MNSISTVAEAFLLVGVAFSVPVTKFDEGQAIDDFNLNQNVYLEMDETGQCIYVKSEEGTYIVNSPGSQQVCGLYLIAEPNKRIEIEFQSFDISCVKGGLLSVIDGWELNGQFFPSAPDRSAEKAFSEFCGNSKKPRKKILTSQNAAVIEYRIPTKGQGFALTVKFVDNPKPCNVILQEPSGVYTLRNYKRKVNCTVSVIFPLSVRVLAASLGAQSNWPLQTLDFETGLLTKCKKRGINDYLEIRGGDGLDPIQMDLVTDYCGLDSLPSGRSVTVACGHTAMRLVSSGRFENSVTFSFDLPEDFGNVDLICPSFLSSATTL